MSDKDKKKMDDDKTRRLDPRTLQLTTDGGQFYCYISKEFGEALGLEKGSKLILFLHEDRIEVYPEEKFLAKAGMGDGQPTG